MKHLLAVLVFMLSLGTAYAGHLKVTLEDLLLLAESGVADKTILAFIEPREISFIIGAEEIAKLRKAGFSEEFIQYLLAISKQAGKTSGQYMIPPVPYPRYYYGPSLFLGFGGGHHALFDHHFVGLHHAAPHHTGLHHDTSIHIAHSGITTGHPIGHTTYHGVSTDSTHSTSINSSHSTGRRHSMIGSSRHNTSSSSAHTAGRNISHSTGRSHSVIGSSRHNTRGQ